MEKLAEKSVGKSVENVENGGDHFDDGVTSSVMVKKSVHQNGYGVSPCYKNPYQKKIG